MLFNITLLTTIKIINMINRINFYIYILCIKNVLLYINVKIFKNIVFLYISLIKPYYIRH